MDLSPDLTDRLAEFDSFGVEYLVVGGWAVSTHAKPRCTKDLDLWIPTSAENLARAANALAVFGRRAICRRRQRMGADDSSSLEHRRPGWTCCAPFRAEHSGRLGRAARAVEGARSQPDLAEGLIAAIARRGGRRNSRPCSCCWP